MSMTSRERIWTSLNHKEPDRIPVDLGGTIVTSICKGAYIDLMDYLGFDLDEEKVAIMDVVQQLPVLDRRLLDWIGVDVLPLLPNPPSTWKLEIKDEGKYYSYVDEWGAKLYMPKGGYYFDYREFPLKESTLEALDKMNWPDPDDPARWEGLRERAEKLYRETDYALVGSALFGGGIFEHPARIRGMEEFLMDTFSNIKFVEAVMEKMMELYLRATENYLNEVGEFIQVFAYWDDVSTQNGPMVSPEFYRKYIKPKQKRLFDLIRSKTDAKIFMHSCGACYEFIPDYIEIGVDILNPVQISADGMGDTAKLKREFGNDIVFWGGGIHSQRVLPFGTPEEIREDVKRRIDDLAPGGGFIFNAVHNMQNFIPPDNIVEMYKTLKENWEY
ncbi:MAG: uroporphyrinogen decarboxylase [Halanaerobiales bacterium]|nr:uroporphyrinogen decarboxylase [Halanaerobiales bacterium]